MPFHVYILRSESTGQFYIGHTNDLVRRIEQHNDPKYSGSKHTKRSKGPWYCVYSEEFNSRSEAMEREKQIKRYKSRKAIEQLILNRQSPESLRD